MDDSAITKIDTIQQYDDLLGVETLHPLVNVIDFSKCTRHLKFNRMMTGFYTLFLKDVKCGDMIYGRETYDYQEGTVVALAPGQVYGFRKADPAVTVKPKGYALVFHPDLLRGTELGRTIRDYSFFSYDVREALHLSEKERDTYVDCLMKLNSELEHAIDKHSKKLIIANIELLLDYCMRYYDRQFITREHVNKDLLAKFETYLDEYFRSDKPQTLGLPTVAACAKELCLSPNYFGDLIRKETGTTAQEHIQLKLMDIAKERVFDTTKSVSEIAYGLGFAYPQHFTRLFKKRTGYTPNAYRTLNNIR